MKRRTLLTTLVLAAIAAALLANCSRTTHEPEVEAEQQPTPRPSPPLTEPDAREVVSVVERIDIGGYVELLPDGTKRWSDLVILAVVEPRQQSKAIHVYSHQPAVGTRALRVGDQLSFVMPVNADSRTLHLSELQKLRFRGASTAAGGWLDPKLAREALVRYMESHPDCFAGFTAGLQLAAKRIVLSDDGRQAFVGSIVVDRLERTYRFERWTESPDGASALHLVWSGRFTVGPGGVLQATAPSLTQERFIRNQ